MRAVAGTAAIPAARCRNLRRGSFIAPPSVRVRNLTTFSVSTALIYGIRRIKTDNIGGEADMPRPPLAYRPVADDPKRTLRGLEIPQCSGESVLSSSIT